MRVVATAGHVDHGKSSLVFALTGTDPDRFAEEKERGLTIDLGFAFATLRSGTEVGFVDVPGHVRFLKNMLAGVGAVDVVMFVVSAREGWMPQSEEHLVILELLGVTHGVVALTNADTIDAEARDDAQQAITSRLSRSCLREAPVVICDSISGRGLDDVRAALDAVLQSAPPAEDRGRPRLWVDRVFAPRGAGTVVTGTLAGGSVAIDDVLEVGRDGTRARVRGIESAHRRVERVAPGTRVALNLSGIERADLARGDALVKPGQWTAAAVVDVAVTSVPDEVVQNRARLQAYVGSGEHEVSFRALDESGRFARLRFAAPLPLAPGDRVVLRDSGRARTVAGAEVLDVDPVGDGRDAAARLALPLGPRLLASRDRVPVADVARLTGLSDAGAAELVAATVESGIASRVDDSLVDTALLTALRNRARELVLGGNGIELATLASRLGVDAGHLRGALDGDARLLVDRGFVRDATRSPITESPEAVALIAALDASPFSPPESQNVALARTLVREGVLVDVAGIVFTASAVDRARELVRERLGAHGTISVGDARDLLDSSRKYVVPLLEHFDREGVTRRRGDVRIPGPTSNPNRRR
ncbi:MAG: selenocysteine-specific translation elongation factor [Acidimicrobiia bacterium]